MTDSLRLMCADILDGLAAVYPGAGRYTTVGRRRARMHSGSDALRYAERWEYGDPVPAAEHRIALDEYEQRVADIEHEIEQANRDDKSRATERRSAFAEFLKAFNAWYESGDDSALIDAFDSYRGRTGA